jgi:hypothetical protein
MHFQITRFTPFYARFLSLGRFLSAYFAYFVVSSIAKPTIHDDMQSKLSKKVHIYIYIYILVYL